MELREALLSQNYEQHFDGKEHRMGDFLASLQDEYLRFKQDGISVYGEKVMLKEKEVKVQVNADGSINVEATWEVCKESGEFLSDITFQSEQITGKLAASMIQHQLRFADYVANLYYLVLNGHLSTLEDEKRYFQSSGMY